MKHKHKLGRFKVSEEFIRRDWRSLLQLFANFVIVDAKWNFATRSVEYLAFSELFEEIEDGVEAPDYAIEVTKHHGDRLTFKASKDIV